MAVLRTSCSTYPRLGPRLLAEAVGLLTRGARRRGGAPGAAVCPTACAHRSGTARTGTAGGPRTGDRRRPGAVARRERAAHEAVASRTTGPEDLASLLDMLDLRRGQGGEGGQH
ncbi:hypothetical protein ABT143_09750 [Streptomyces sp. NPDC002033]|uniref:hypothetical protein n=1 Tax=unclassified Streptomyces TaxID=2593676 RepID=UPI00331D0C31